MKAIFNAGISYFGIVDVDLRMRYVSGTTFAEVSAVPVDDYTTVDLAVSKAFSKAIFLKLSVMNLLDDKHYEYPLYTKMTRKAMLTLKYSF
jgi:outer membrane cobalamin receptor